MAAGLHFDTDYDLAAFIVRFLVLPALVACAVASTCFLRNWKGLSRNLTVTYHVAVATFLISQIFWIVYDALYASKLDTYSERNFVSDWRPLYIFDVVCAAIDDIARVAAFAAVAYFAFTFASISGRPRVVKIFASLAVVVLSALLIANIGIRAHTVDVEMTEQVAVYASDVSYYRDDPFAATHSWKARQRAVEVAFHAFYILAVLVVGVISLSTRNWPLRSAQLLLLLIAVLDLVFSAWSMSVNAFYDQNFDYFAEVQYNWIETIMVIILQTGVYVALLFAPSRPLKQ